jgi:hypothetical protein
MSTFLSDYDFKQLTGHTSLLWLDSKSVGPDKGTLALSVRQTHRHSLLRGALRGLLWRQLVSICSKRSADSCHDFLNHRTNGRVTEHYWSLDERKGTEHNFAVFLTFHQTHENLDTSFLISSVSFSKDQLKAYTRYEKGWPRQSNCSSPSWSQSRDH